jgi:ketosteroid isomerase-like protein
VSRENVEIVRRVYEASGRRDREAVLALYHPEVVWDMSHHPMVLVLGEPTYRVGHEGLRAWFQDWYEAFEDFEHTCEELIEVGDQVVSVGTDRGHGRESGVDVERQIAGLWTIREGKIVRVVWFPSREEALRAAGASDDTPGDTG